MLHISWLCVLTVNVALNKPSYQQYQLLPGYDKYDASNAVDGRKSDFSWDGHQCSASTDEQTATWWVNLTSIYSIHHITIYFITNNKGKFIVIISSTSCIQQYCKLWSMQYKNVNYVNTLLIVCIWFRVLFLPNLQFQYVRDTYSFLTIYIFF